MNFYTEYRSRSFLDQNNNYLFTDVVKYDAEGNVTAEYKSSDNEIFYQEHIGRIKLNGDGTPAYQLGWGIMWIAKGHFAEIKKTVRSIEQLGMTVNQAISNGVFAGYRNIAIQEKAEKSKQIEAYQKKVRESPQINRRQFNSITKYTEYFTTCFKDKLGRRLFLDVVGYDPTGLVTAKYISHTGEVFFQEEIGTIKLGNHIDYSQYDVLEKIEEIMQKHLTHLEEVTLKKIDELNLGVRTAISLGVFTECRKIDIDERDNAEKAQQKLQEANKFLNNLEFRMKQDHYLRLNVEPELEVDEKQPSWYPVSTQDGKTVIRDKEWSFYISCARFLLVNPYKKIPYPNFYEFLNSFIESRRTRLNYINMISCDYELYSDDKLIFRKSSEKLEFFDPVKFADLCKLPDEKFLFEVIDDTFIENAIKKGNVPESCGKKLEKYKGMEIIDAIKNESGIRGNKKREAKIRNDEIKDLESVDGFLFDAIYHMCDDSEYRDSAIGDIKCSVKSWSEVEKTYKYLQGYDGLTIEEIYMRTKWGPNYLGPGNRQPAWMKLKKIYGYLRGRKDESVLNLNPDTLGELLKITKMFDLAIAILNCSRLNKLTFLRGSHDIRLLILEKAPYFNSCDVFSKTLFLDKLCNESYRLDPNNWVAQRVGLQAKLYANTFISAKTLSAEGEDNVLAGGRGNTATGKSTALGKKKGILNTDPNKFALRKGTEVKNHQVHLEGAMIFDLCFQDIVKAKLNYIVDLRLITLDSIKQYLVDPAKKNECTILMSDLDVPLLTTLNRVLNRDPKGEDPIPSLQPMVSGFKDIRRHRKEVMEFAKNEKIIEQYDLYYLGKIVGRKEFGDIAIIDEEGYKICFHIPDDEEIENDLNRIIDENYIEEAYARGDFRTSDTNSLSQWIGFTVRKALEEHANS